MGHHEPERRLAVLQAGMFDRGPLIDTGRDEDRPGEEDARRLHHRRQQRKPLECVLQRGRSNAEETPDGEVAKNEGARRCAGARAFSSTLARDRGVEQHHRRRTRQHHRGHHRDPHDADDQRLPGCPRPAAHRHQHAVHLVLHPRAGEQIAP